MRALLISCLIAVTSAQYDYNPVQDEAGAAQLSQPIHHEPEYNKEFYSYSAPDGEFDDPSGNDHIAAVKKNLRVVFIKAPEATGLENAVLQLAHAANEDRTAIYVLNRQADVSGLANQLQALKSNANNKPEVHFVKYLTQSDADNAQRTIQSQYDSLPGPSSNHNGGSAPVLDFASKSVPSAGYSVSSPTSAYLPPGRRF